MKEGTRVRNVRTDELGTVVEANLYDPDTMVAVEYDCDPGTVWVTPKAKLAEAKS